MSGAIGAPIRIAVISAEEIDTAPDGVYLTQLAWEGEEIADQLEDADPAARPGLEVRLQMLDERSTRLEREILQADDAIAVAVLRRSFPSSRSSWRTPASRVYSDTIVSTSTSSITTSSSRRPLRSRWRGQR